MPWRSCLSLVVVLSVAALPAKAQTTLAWKFQNGDQFYIKTVSHVKQTMKALGKELKQDVEMTSVLGYTIVDRKDDQLVVKQTIESLAFKTGGAASSKDTNLEGITFTITLGPKMEILKFEGYDKLVDRLAKSDETLRKTIPTLMSEDAFKLSVLEALAFLPDKAVKVGDSWNHTSLAPLGPLGKFELSHVYKYEGKDNVGGKPVEKISFTTAVDYKPARADKALPYHVLSGELKVNESTGTLHFDSAAGRLIQSKATVSLRGKMSLATGSSNPIETEIQQEQTIRVVLLNDKPSN